MSDRPNALQMPGPLGSDDNALAADAWDANRKAYADWLARDRQRQIAMGYVDPQTGQLTPAGWKAQAQIIGGGFGPADVGMAGGFGGLIKNYHGSPHLFPPTPKNPLGEFNPAKIGTGEGAQAYGVGAGYTADLEATSRGYLPKPGEPIPISPEFKTALHNEDYLGFDTASQAIAAIRAHPDWAQRWDVSDPAPLKSAFEAHEVVRRANSGGHMYEVNIHAEPEDFLHWDKPISDQSPAVKNAVADLMAQHGIKLGNATGEQVYKALSEKLAASRPPEPGGWTSAPGGAAWGDLAHDPAAASAALQATGIPGIRYLDQGSRSLGPDHPDATHIHVTFDPDKLEIIRRFGIAGLIGGGGAAATAAGGQDQGNQ